MSSFIPLIIIIFIYLRQPGHPLRLPHQRSLRQRMIYYIQSYLNGKSFTLQSGPNNFSNDGAGYLS
jgi:hypothetical protein